MPLANLQPVLQRDLLTSKHKSVKPRETIILPKLIIQENHSNSQKPNKYYRKKNKEKVANYNIYIPFTAPRKKAEQKMKTT